MDVTCSRDSCQIWLLIGVGLTRYATGGLGPLPAPPDTGSAGSGLTAVGTLTPFLLLRAFSSGAVALTGVEAISNGVPAFRRPEARNAAAALTWMGLVLGIGVFGTALLTRLLQPALTDEETLLSILGQAVFGAGSVLYYTFQAATFAILVLAANTAFADFPRLASIMARDGFMPHQYAIRGDRLVFSNGIITLAALAAVLLVIFGGDTAALIPLYAVGVFTGFTLSQSGMVRHHLRTRELRWRRNIVVNGLGATATAIVLAVVLISKFTIGAWIPAVLIPILVKAFRATAEHYRRVATDLDTPPAPPPTHHAVVLLVGRVHRGTTEALAYARILKGDGLHAVHVSLGENDGHDIRDAWDGQHPGFPLEILPSPYRDLTGSMLRYIENLHRRHPGTVVTIIIPDYVEAHWWDNLLHNQSALTLLTRLREIPNTVVATVPLLASTARAGQNLAANPFFAGRRTNQPTAAALRSTGERPTR